MRNALTLTEKETFFIKENRQDPVTGDEFDIGDEIVFCASCKSAFLKDSWEYMDSKHCGQSFTLHQFPRASKLTLSKPINYNFKFPDEGSRVIAYFIDNFIAILLGALVYLFFTKLKKTLHIEAESAGFMVGSFYMLFSDIILIKSSIGKRIMNLYFIDSKTKRIAPRLRLVLRNVVYWLCLFTLISIITILEVILNAGGVIAVLSSVALIIANIVHVINVLANQDNIFDRILGIKLVEKN